LDAAQGDDLPEGFSGGSTTCSPSRVSRFP
jgi:hypothetical protein